MFQKNKWYKKLKLPTNLKQESKVEQDLNARNLSKSMLKITSQIMITKTTTRHRMHLIIIAQETLLLPKNIILNKKTPILILQLPTNLKIIIKRTLSKK